MWIKFLILLFAFACVALPAAAFEFGHHPPGGGSWPPPVVHSAPGPEAGVGLPFLAVGGLLWLQRRKRRAAASGNQGA